MPTGQSESLFLTFNFNVQNFNVIVIENELLLSVLKFDCLDRIYKIIRRIKCECLNYVSKHVLHKIISN